MDTLSIYAPGHWDYFDSYGLIACQLGRHLSQMGHYVNAMALGHTVLEGQPADVRAVTERPIRPCWGGLLLGYPTVYEHYPPLAHSGPRVALSMFESTRLPVGWVEVFNTLDAVIVPSVFCADVFRHNGVEAPIHTIPLGINEVYRPAARPGGKPFTFLAFADRGIRKGSAIALQAFIKAFDEDPAYRLILKSRKQKLRVQILNENVDLIQEDYTEDQLYDLYKSCDCLINPNAGEGFGLIPREFAATGGISLATNWGGTADDIDKWGIPIPFDLTPADWSEFTKWRGQDLGEWAAPNLDLLADLLISVAENAQERSRRAFEQAPAVRRLYDWRAFAEAVYGVWQGVTNG